MPNRLEKGKLNVEVRSCVSTIFHSFVTPFVCGSATLYSAWLFSQDYNKFLTGTGIASGLTAVAYWAYRDTNRN